MCWPQAAANISIKTGRTVFYHKIAKTGIKRVKLTPLRLTVINRVAKISFVLLFIYIFYSAVLG